MPTDIAAGMILVQMNQQKSPRRLKTSTLVIKPSSPLPPKRHFKKGKKRHKLGKVTPEQKYIEHSKSLYRDNSGPVNALPSQPSRSISLPDTVQDRVPDVLVDIAQDQDHSITRLALDTQEVHLTNKSEASANGNAQNCVINMDRSDGSDIDKVEGDEDEEEEAGPSGSIPVCPVLGDGLRYIDPSPWMSIHNATHYMKYAMGSYGWPLYAFMNLPFGCCKLLCKCR